MAAPHIPPWAYSWVIWSAVKPCCACELFSRSRTFAALTAAWGGHAQTPGYCLALLPAPSWPGDYAADMQSKPRPLTLQGEGGNVSSLPPGSVGTHAMYICMFVRRNVMQGTLGLFGSSVSQELEAKKRQENKIKRKRSHARRTAMFPYLLCLQCFVNRFQWVCL